MMRAVACDLKSDEILSGGRKDQRSLTLGSALSRAGLTAIENEMMSRHTTYHIGGPADWFVVAEAQEQLVTAIGQARKHGITPFLLGGGANILVADAGIRGMVIAYRASRYAFQEEDGAVVLRTEAGAQIKEIARESVSRGLEGLEWAVDIPGTVGGAIVGNAGAFGGYIGDCLRSVKVLECDGTVQETERNDVAFCYRGSRFKRQNCEERTIILEATISLRRGDAEGISERAAQYSERRWERQPTEPSCGSVFKRTANYPAGFLIEQCGLKGERRGDAMISPRHANFIVNLGNAKASEVKSLIELAQERVRSEFGETLELEVELVGQW